MYVIDYLNYWFFSMYNNAQYKKLEITLSEKFVAT